MSPHTPAPRARRRWIRVLAIVGAAVVPLAFAGLTMASLADTEDGIHRIPAAIVNQDEMVDQTAPDGSTTPVLAGRLLVTELTGTDSPGMDWRLSNAAEAKAALADGEVYAVLTIPADFSASVISLSGSDPVQAQLSLTTDDAHSYLAGSVAQSLGEGMVRAFGSTLTEQYISGMYTQFGTIGEAFTQAADGAGQLADGAAQAATGSAQYADGVASYTRGASSLSAGLQTMKRETAGLGQLGAGVLDYTAGVSQLSAALTAAANDVAANPGDPQKLGTLQYLTAQLELAAAKGTALGDGASGLGALADGIAQTADGAARLATSGGAITSGARSLADGNAQLASGASELANGLQAGAAQLGSADATASSDAASVAADPVGLDVTVANAVTGIGQVVGTYLVPLGLWVGGLAIFLVVPPLSRRILASTAGSGRVLGSALARATAVAGVQAALLVLLMHLVAGVSWTLLPATLAFSLVAAAAFTAFHQLLTVGLGRAGLVISLLLVSLQLAAVGGILPSQALAGPFAWLGGIMPLGWATTGLHQLVAGGDAGTVVASALGLAVFGAASLLVSRLAIRRTRRANALGMLLPAAP
ncbi:YhgE/Pip family protein [Protaetiibacter larvae]|uniref:YhgE/Pip domain-containing protein n=1 Tax=Protaetiibacter larvae TaxID=2592654 RepID=A0A5C1Y4C0_9MICO|nr:YhgE/Pip family protein [Protaetiibacter larvae]QEO08560.1 hypothetical protein FLP23_00055 [Protaetiibacter larvae]